MNDPTPIDRPLTTEEHELTRWMLEHGMHEAAAFLEQLDRARVVGKCRCGCASIDLEVEGLGKAPPGVHILGDFIYGDESNLCGVFVFESAGILSGLEVYSFAADTPKTLPTPLRPPADHRHQRTELKNRKLGSPTPVSSVLCYDSSSEVFT